MNKIIITMGDPAGVGAEIVLKYIKELGNINFLPVVVGSKSILDYYNKIYNINLKIIEVESDRLEKIKFEKATLYLINIDMSIDDLKFGEDSKLAGEYTMKYLETACDLVESGLFDAMVTAPLSKDSINRAGYKFGGHTSFLANRFDTKNFGMVLKGKKITVVLNTTHLSIAAAVKEVKKESILKKIILADRAKKELGINTKIAVAGLNPHNGENGLFGDEEEKEIIPAIKEAKELGIDVEGPIVPDALFVKMLKDEYNIAVVMYHDQGLIPMKMESFGKGVNITVGLPIIRTSVDHGTAFDIVGENRADSGSLNSAVDSANMIIKNRKNI